MNDKELVERVTTVLRWLFLGGDVEIDLGSGVMRSIVLCEDYRLGQKAKRTRTVDGEKVEDEVYMGVPITLSRFIRTVKDIPEERMVEISGNVVLNEWRSR